MANWTDSEYKIEGDIDTLKKIEKIINEFHDGTRKPKKDADKDWEGNLLMTLGYSEKQLKEFDLRGFFIEWEIEDNKVLRIVAEEAWSRTDFCELLEGLFPDIAVYFYVEEPGSEIYETNDEQGKYFPDRYYVDACIDGDEDSDYFRSREEADKYISKLLDDGKDTHTEDELEQWNEEHYKTSEFIYLHEIELV